MNKKEQLLNWLSQEYNWVQKGVTANEVAEKYHLSRSLVSRYFNQLVMEHKMLKLEGRPVLYRLVEGLNRADNPLTITQESTKSHVVQNAKTPEFKIIGALGSLKKAVKQAKAAVLYPPNGLHTMIYGQTGVGKSLFAKEMFQYAILIERISEMAPFVILNCADYADNPQLLMGELFGVKKGAYTGADKDREGLIQKANGGLLFLDEVHRLPPQGQEILFTFMDYGHFRALGSNHDVQGVQTQIVMATTEDPESVLLDTFKRRIPIFIELPPLSQRTLEERKELIVMFMKQEALRIKKPIAISRNAFISLLLYPCKSNIGQLRSDIQQACAKAFLHYVSHDESYIKVRSIDLSQEAKQGYNQYKANRAKIDQLLPPGEETIHAEKLSAVVEVSTDKSEDFYTSIESKIHLLKSQGLSEDEVSQIVGGEIEKKFNQYLQSMKDNASDQYISKVVSEELINLTNQLMNIASNRLNRTFPLSLKSAFTLHMASAIERIQNRQSIFNPKLNQIRILHMEEFVVAMDMARELELNLGIVLPIDEIGYMTMFLITHDEIEPTSRTNKLPIIVVMHGKSTATSMVDVVNELIGEPFAVAFDMPLSMAVEEMYQTITHYLVHHQIKEALMMVDMGSLSNFGEMLYEDHGLHVRTLSQTSTPILLEVARKVASGQPLDEIYNSMNKTFGVSRAAVRTTVTSDQLLIITACFTGEGTAERMKRIIEKRLGDVKNIHIKSIDLSDRSAYLATIDHYKSEFQVIAIASTINIPVDQVPVFSALDLLQEDGLKRFDEVIEQALLMNEISKNIQENVVRPSHQLVKASNDFIDDAEKRFGFNLQKDARVGFLLHMVFYIDNKLKNIEPKYFEEYKSFLLEHGIEFEKIKPAFDDLEEVFGIQVSTPERAFLCNIMMSNASSVQNK